MKTITVKGNGRVSLAPDLVIVSFAVKSLNKNYEKSVDAVSAKLKALNDALCEAGFGKDELKTTDYNVMTEYSSSCDKNGNYRQVFSGYRCIHRMKLEFDFEETRLSKVLSTVSAAVAEPELNVRFSVRDKEAASEELLRNATANAARNARILADASGVKLGALQSISYNWNDTEFVSPARYENTALMMAKCDRAGGIEMNPEDITAEDSATFVWEIV